MIQRRVTIFCKLAIFWVVMVSGENFNVRAPKCRADYKQSKTSWRRSKCYYRYDLYYAWVQNVFTDGTFITLGSKCYYRWDLYYTWVQLLHLCLLQYPRATLTSTVLSKPSLLRASITWWLHSHNIYHFFYNKIKTEQLLILRIDSRKMTCEFCHLPGIMAPSNNFFYKSFSFMKTLALNK